MEPTQCENFAECVMSERAVKLKTSRLSGPHPRYQTWRTTRWQSCSRGWFQISLRLCRLFVLCLLRVMLWNVFRRETIHLTVAPVASQQKTNDWSHLQQCNCWDKNSPRPKWATGSISHRYPEPPSMIRVWGPLFLVYNTTLAPLAKAPNLVFGITRSQELVKPWDGDRWGWGYTVILLPRIFILTKTKHSPGWLCRQKVAVRHFHHETPAAPDGHRHQSLWQQLLESHYSDDAVQVSTRENSLLNVLRSCEDTSTPCLNRHGTNYVGGFSLKRGGRHRSTVELWRHPVVTCWNNSMNTLTSSSSFRLWRLPNIQLLYLGVSMLSPAHPIDWHHSH